MLYALPTNVRLLLAELEMLPHGSTASWNPTGGGDGDDPRPPGCSSPPHLTLRADYLAATTDADRDRVVAAMNRTLREYRGVDVDRSRVVGETREQEDRRIIRTGEGFSAADVARRFNCTPTRVRRARMAAGREVDFGRHPANPPDPATTLDPADEAARMKSSGMSERQIAFTLGEHRTTVTRWLKKAA